MEVRGVWSGLNFLLVPPPSPLPPLSLHRLYFHGGPIVISRQSWLSRHDCMFRPNPNLFLHTVMVVMEMESGKLIWEGEGDIERWRGREGKVWSRIVEMSRPVRMHWFRITFLFHLNETDGAILWERNPDFSLETQYLHHTNRGDMEGKVIQNGNMALSSYPAQPYWCVWAFHCSAKNEVFQGRSHWQITKTSYFVEHDRSSLVIWIIWAVLRWHGKTVCETLCG